MVYTESVLNCFRLVVITKADLADDEWLRMLEEDIKARVRGTFLEGKPVLRASARTGEGIEALREALHELALHTAEKSARAPFRLPIDRVFSVDGFGTVVTGTLIDGCIAAGEEAALLPRAEMCRVRNLQVHGRDVEAACAGQRVAVNLSGIRKENVCRGDVLCAPDSLRPTRMLDVRLQNLRDSRRVIESGARLHLYHGAAVRLAKAVLLDRDALRPGESCYAQLRLSEALAARQGDRFVVRFYSPLETVGGGVILDEHPYRHKRNDARVIASLAVRESGSDEAKLVQAVGERGADGMTLADLAACFDEPEEKLVEMLAVLCARGKLVEIAPSRYLTSSTLDRLWTDCETMLTKYHREHPLYAGMRLAEARQRLFRGGTRQNAEAILACFAREGKLKRTTEYCALADFSVRLTRRQRAIREEMLRLCRAAGPTGLKTDELCASFDRKDRTECAQVIESLLSVGELVLLTPDRCIEKSVLSAVDARVKAWFETRDTLALGEFRDVLGTSRDHALLLLEYYDRRGILRREGDVRRAGAHFGEL